MSAGEIHELVLPGGVPVTCRCAIGDDHNLKDVEALTLAAEQVTTELQVDTSEHSLVNPDEARRALAVDLAIRATVGGGGELHWPVDKIQLGLLVAAQKIDRFIHGPYGS